MGYVTVPPMRGVWSAGLSVISETAENDRKRSEGAFWSENVHFMIGNRNSMPVTIRHVLIFTGVLPVKPLFGPFFDLF